MPKMVIEVAEQLIEVWKTMAEQLADESHTLPLSTSYPPLIFQNGHWVSSTKTITNSLRRGFYINCFSGRISHNFSHHRSEEHTSELQSQR